MNCPDCHQPLIQIDRYGERWIGCIHRNKWGKPGDRNLMMELSEGDLEALRELRKSNENN
jgi:hypothetical protein